MGSSDSIDSGFNSISIGSDLGSLIINDKSSGRKARNKSSKVTLGDPCEDYLNSPMFNSLHQKQRTNWNKANQWKERTVILKPVKYSVRKEKYFPICKEELGFKVQKKCKIM